MNILRKLFNSKKQESLKFTPLHIAVKNNEIDIVRKLIKEGANIDAISKHDDTPLLIAVKNDNEKITSLLIKKGANIDAISKYGDTLLDIAIKNANVGITSLMIKKGAKSKSLISKFTKKTRYKTKEFTGNVEERRKKYDMSCPAMEAITSGKFEILLHHLNKGIDINWCDGFEISLLMYAAGSNNQNILKLLLLMGADIHASDINGKSAFDWTEIRKKTKNLDILNEFVPPEERISVKDMKDIDHTNIESKLSLPNLGELLFYSKKENIDRAMFLISSEDQKIIYQLIQKFPNISKRDIILLYRFSETNEVHTFSTDSFNELLAKESCEMYQKGLFNIKEVKGFYCIYSKPMK